MAFYIDSKGDHQEIPKLDMYNQMSLYTGIGSVDIKDDTPNSKNSSGTQDGLYRDKNDTDPSVEVYNEASTRPLHVQTSKQQSILKKLREKLKAREGYNEVSIHMRKVENFMQKPKAIAFEDIKLTEAWALFKQYQLHFIPIVDKNEKYRGIISDRGLLFYLLEKANDDALNGGIQSFLMENAITLEPDSSLKEAALAIIESNAYMIPVIDSNKGIAGVIDPIDVLRTLFINKRPLNLVK